MEKERLAIILYTILGCVVGIISIYSTNYLSLFALVFGVYFVTVIPVAKKISVNKITTWLLSNAFLTYFLVWFVVYVLLSNALVV